MALHSLFYANKDVAKCSSDSLALMIPCWLSIIGVLAVKQNVLS